VNTDAQKIREELIVLRDGVIDTSSLIYLEQIHLLQAAGDFFHFRVPSEVIDEFGRCPDGCVVYEKEEAITTDQAVVQLAEELKLPVFSEDRQLLMASGRLGLKYYNTLMLLLSLLLQKQIDLAGYHEAHACLQKTARYSPVVWQTGENVFSLYVR